MRVRASKASRRASGSRAAHARTHRSRLNHEDVRLHPFLLRGARLRQGTSLARVHGARANPDRRDARNAGASDAEFSWRVRPGEQGERTGRPAPARTRSARCFRARGIDRTRDRPRRGGSPGSTSTDTHRRSASRDSTLTLLSGFERSTLFDAPRFPLLASRLTVRSLPCDKKSNSSRRARPPWRAAAAPSRRTRRST